MSADVHEIKSRVDLVELVRERVRLTQTGRGWKGRCPFHEDRTPSFFVYNDGRYVCFGCNEHGDVFNWVQKTEGVDFPEALRILALRAGVTLSGEKAQKTADSNQLRAVLESCLKFFREQLDVSEVAREYAASRGLDSESISRWEIGYAPDFDESLIRWLRAQNISLALAQTAGVVSGDERRGYRDFFRSRLIFPIRDESSRLIAFGGRQIGPGEPKYLNSPEIPGLFDKGQTLYGLQRARAPISERKEAVLCEGYLDVIACHRAGIESAVAPLGTGFTIGHARKLKRYAEKVITLFDGDKAGKAASKRTAELCTSIDLDARIAILPEGEDPDTMVARGDVAKLIERAQTPTTPLRFEVRELTSEVPPGETISDPTFWTRISRLLAAANPAEAEMLVVELAAKHPASKQSHQDAANAIRRQIQQEADRTRKVSRRTQNGSNIAPVKMVLPDGAERPILRAALSEAFRALVWQHLREPGLIVSTAGRLLADALLENFDEPPTGPTGQLISTLDSEAALMAAALERPAEHIYDRPAEGDLSLALIEEALATLRATREHREKLAEFEESGDLAALSEYLRSKHGDSGSTA